nr:hypothetical protein [Tanacetum cinerariifolium]
MGGREDISHCHGLAHKRSEGWDANNNLYSTADVTSLDTHRTPIQKPPEVLLCLVGLIWRYFLGDDVYPIFLDDDDRDMDLFNLISAPNPTMVKTRTHPHAAHESTHGGKSLASMGLDVGSLLSTPAAQDPSTATKSVSDPEPLSYENPQPHLEKDIAQSSKGTATNILTEDAATTEVNIQFSVGSPESGRSSFFPSMVGSPGVAMGSQLWLRFEQEVRLLKKSRSKIARRGQRIQVMGEEKIKVAFEEFKKYEDDKVEQRCAEVDARLDKLSVDFDEELYLYMLTAIAGRRWVIGHSLRLANGMSEGLKYGIEHGKAGRDLADVEPYDPESNNKLVKALQDLKDLKSDVDAATQTEKADQEEPHPRL